MRTTRRPRQRFDPLQQLGEARIRSTLPHESCVLARSLVGCSWWSPTRQAAPSRWTARAAIHEPGGSGGQVAVGCEAGHMDDKRRFHLAAVERAAGSSGAPRVPGAARALAVGSNVRSVVLVEGSSDQAALEALARRHGRDLDAEDVAVVPIGGAQAIGSFLVRFGPRGLDLRLAGLCDAGEEGDFRRGLERAGLGSNLTRAGMESLGFYVCLVDLEDELIRSLGTASVEQVVDAQRELGSFRIFQKQPAQQDRTHEAQLRRFMGTRSGRKIHYARLLVEALDLTKVPRPLDRVLAHV